MSARDRSSNRRYFNPVVLRLAKLRRDTKSTPVVSGAIDCGHLLQQRLARSDLNSVEMKFFTAEAFCAASTTQ